MVNEANMQKWLDALRSGKFKQGRAFLVQRRGSGQFVHCCLGVGAEVMGCKRLTYSNSDTRAGFRFKSGQKLRYPGVEFAEWLGISTRDTVKWSPVLNANQDQINSVVPPNGRYMGLSGLIPLSNLNDEGYSFEEIADLIETFGIVED